MILTDHISSIRLSHIDPGTIAQPPEEDHSNRIKHSDEGNDIGAIRLREVVPHQVLSNVKVRYNEPDEQQQDGEIDEGEFGVQEQGKVEDALNQIHKVVVPFLNKSQKTLKTQSPLHTFLPHSPPRSPWPA